MKKVLPKVLTVGLAALALAGSAMPAQATTTTDPSPSEPTYTEVPALERALEEVVCIGGYFASTELMGGGAVTTEPDPAGFGDPDGVRYTAYWNVAWFETVPWEASDEQDPADHHRYLSLAVPQDITGINLDFGDAPGPTVDLGKHYQLDPAYYTLKLTAEPVDPEEPFAPDAVTEFTVPFSDVPCPVYLFGDVIREAEPTARGPVPEVTKQTEPVAPVVDTPKLVADPTPEPVVEPVSVIEPAPVIEEPAPRKAPQPTAALPGHE